MGDIADIIFYHLGTGVLADKIKMDQYILLGHLAHEILAALPGPGNKAQGLLKAESAGSLQPSKLSFPCDQEFA